MTRPTWMLCAAALALMTLAATAAETPPPAPQAAEPATPEPAKAEPAKPVLEGEAAVMAKECKLTEVQQTELLKTNTATQAEIAEWQKANAEQIAAFGKAREAAIAAGDEAAFRKVMDDARPLMAQYGTIVAKHRKALQDLLTPEQRSTWEGFSLWREIAAELKPLKPTDEQLAKCRALTDAAAREMADAKGTEEEVAAARRAAMRKLTEGILGNVLTAEQKAMLAPPAAADSAAEPKPDTPAKAPEGEAPPPAGKAPADAAK